MRRALVPLILGALALALASVASAAPRAVELARYDWTDLPRDFRGLSGIEMSTDGATFTVISDSGLIGTGRVQRGNGQIVGWQLETKTALRTPQGVARPAGELDAEGLVTRADGTLAISLEGPTRVLSYDRPDSRAREITVSEPIPVLRDNRGIEALAEDAQGCLIALLERVETSGFRIYRNCGRRWRVSAILEKVGAFLPVGADLGPDGWLYVLERHFNGVGFRSRIRRLHLSQPDLGYQVLLTTPVWAYDNLEGLSVWTDAQGGLRLTTVSDDNFNPLQKTQIVEFAVRE